MTRGSPPCRLTGATGPSRKRVTTGPLTIEGDSLLAVILSKAFLLAADDQITDTTITRQISRQ